MINNGLMWRGCLKTVWWGVLESHPLPTCWMFLDKAHHTTAAIKRWTGLLENAVSPTTANGSMHLVTTQKRTKSRQAKRSITECGTSRQDCSLALQWLNAGTKLQCHLASFWFNPLLIYSFSLHPKFSEKMSQT